MRKEFILFGIISFILIASFVLIYSGTTPSVDSNMVLYYHLNNDSTLGENDTLAVDVSSSGNNGTIQDAKFNSSSGILFDGAFEFDGARDNITLDTHTNIPNGTNAVSVAFWFNPNTFHTATNNQIISLYEEGGGEGSSLSVVAEDNAISVRIEGHRVITPKNALSIGTWYHVVMTIPESSTSDNVKVYINGSEQTLSDEAGSIRTLNFNATNVIIGNGQTATTYYNGTLDEIIIYNKKLSASEVSTLYQTYVNPTVTLINPTNGKEDTDGIVTFSYNVSDTDAISGTVSSCTLNLAGKERSGEPTDSQTDTSITEDTTQSFTISNIIKSNKLEWYVTCTDGAHTGTSSTREIDTQVGSSIGGSSIKEQKQVPPETIKQTRNIFEVIWDFIKSIFGG